MGMIFIAVNGDNVGDSIGQAVASDNHEELSRISGSIKDSQSKIDEWVQGVGGRVVATSGDEGIYQIPSEMTNQLEKIRSDYSKTSGHTLTIGVGNSISEASKALLYGKYNEKDQIVQYEPSIEDYINSEDDDDEIPSSEDIETDSSHELETEAGVAPPQEQGYDETQEQDQSEEFDRDLDSDAQMEMEGGQAPESNEDQGEMSIDEQEMQGQDQYIDNVGDDTEDAANAELEEESVGEEDADEIIGNVADEGIDGEVDGQVPSQEMQGEATESDEDDLQDMEAQDVDGDGDIDEMSMNDGTQGEEDQDSYENTLTNMVSGHMEGEEDDGMEGNPEMEGEMPPTGGEMQDPNMGDEDDLQDMEAQDVDGDGDIDEMSMNDGTQGEMEGEEEYMPEDEESEDGSDDELKADITNSLMSFKQNKQILEGLQQSNPELYQSTITMLRAMIEMSKRLGFAPQEVEMGEGEAAPEEEYQEMGEDDVDQGDGSEGEGEEEFEEEEVEEPEMPSSEDEDDDVKKQ